MSTTCMAVYAFYVLSQQVRRLIHGGCMLDPSVDGGRLGDREEEEDNGGSSGMAAEKPPRRARRQAPLNEADRSTNPYA
jgi:hypothetical protein